MSLTGDLTRENDIKNVVDLIQIKIHRNDHPEVVRVLKDLGRQVLKMLDNTPLWAKEYEEKFRP